LLLAKEREESWRVDGGSVVSKVHVDGENFRQKQPFQVMSVGHFSDSD
jgi:hypothetical protein